MHVWRMFFTRLSMPHGRLRPGYEKVAGVVTSEIYRELLAFQTERNLPSLSQAVGQALREWRQERRRAVQNPDNGVEESA